MKEIVIFGTGDIGRLANVYFDRDSEYQVVAFTVDRAYMQDETFEGRPVVPFEEVRDRFPPSRYAMFVAMSYTRMNQVRSEKYDAAKRIGYELVSYVSSRCTYLSDYPPGDNCFILEDNTIQPFARIGSDVTLWSGNHIGHDSVIGDHCFITSHVVVSGNTTIGDHCFVGVNATLRNSITIAPETLIGAGAIVMKNTNEKEVVMPARSVVLDLKSNKVRL